METKRIQRTEDLAKARDSITLAQQGLYRCQFCKQAKPLRDGIVITAGGTVIFALCPSCHPGRPIVVEQRIMDGRPVVHIGFLRPEDRPADLVIAPSIARVNEFIPQRVLQRFRKNNWGEEE